MNLSFTSRRDAGRSLARKLARVRFRAEPLVVGLARGGVPVAFEVALHLGAPLDVLAVRKLGVPGCEEVAMGAIATGGTIIINAEVLDRLGISQEMVESATYREERELHRCEQEYRHNSGVPAVRGRTVILVDDGIATGCTMLAAANSLHQAGALEIIVATPVAARQSLRHLRELAKRLVVLSSREQVPSISHAYFDFTQTTDLEISDLLRLATERPDQTH